MPRNSSFERITKETKISGSLKLDGKGQSKVDTGIGFLDHMLNLFAFHAGIDLTLTCKGDLEVCAHHTVEDIALTIGAALLEAMGEKIGIARYACEYLPMDETLSRTVIDISGRPYHVFMGAFQTAAIGSLPTEMIKHFFYSLSMSAKITLHQEIIYGENDHHKAESLFKSCGRCIRQALTIVSNRLPSTKGKL